MITVWRLKSRNANGLVFKVCIFNYYWESRNFYFLLCRNCSPEGIKVSASQSYRQYLIQREIAQKFDSYFLNMVVLFRQHENVHLSTWKHFVNKYGTLWKGHGIHKPGPRNSVISCVALGYSLDFLWASVSSSEIYNSGYCDFLSSLSCKNRKKKKNLNPHSQFSFFLKKLEHWEAKNPV